MRRIGLKFWAAAVVSAGLLELPFPLAGPLPPGRSVVAWFALAPLIWAVLATGIGDHRTGDRDQGSGIRRRRENRHPPRRAFLLSYLCGVLWFAGNCYWIYDTMMIHGGLSPLVSVLLLVGYSMVLGAYFGLFGLGIAVVQRRLGTGWALATAPVSWAGIELLASRITSVPWDQLGYSQVDNALVTPMATITGVYGISFVVVAVNALLAGGLVLDKPWHRRWSGLAGAVLLLGGSAGLLMTPPRPAGTATAVLIQPNLDVTADNSWPGTQWDEHIAEFAKLAGEECKTYIAGIPQTGAPNGEVMCPPYPTYPDLVAWPESPAPFVEADPKFQRALAGIARGEQSAVVVGNIGTDYSSDEQQWHDYNSALLVAADGTRIGRYDKIHLVPFGEFIPFKDLLFFAHKLTGKVSEFTRGTDRRVFVVRDHEGKVHRYGIFICYESVFADEVRQFARHGAEVLVNISDDGWYGDTSAAWQHLNMARMRAIENRRWILRDTNTGVTAAIDPYGRVRQSIPRHAVDALPAQFGFRDDVTFYTEHGDVFGWACAILALGIVLVALKFGAAIHPRFRLKVRS